MYLSIRVKSLTSLKVRSILRPPKKISKSSKVGRFSENHAKSKSPYGYPSFSYNFPKIYSKTRVNELHERASQTSSTQTKQTKYSPRAPRVSEPSAFYTNQENQANQACSVRTK